MIVLDSGAVTAFARQSRSSRRTLVDTLDGDAWPAVVPTPVLIECLRGDRDRDATTNRFLKTCDVIGIIPEALARRAAELRTRARRGSAIDALVVAFAEPGGTVLTSDVGDLRALAQHADDVTVERV